MRPQFEQSPNAKACAAALLVRSVRSSVGSEALDETGDTLLIEFGVREQREKVSACHQFCVCAIAG